MRKFTRVWRSKYLLLGLCSIFFAANVQAWDKTPSAAQPNTPLKQLLMVFSDPQGVNVNERADRYLNIKGIKWESEVMRQKNNYFSNKGYMKQTILGKSEIDLRGRDGYVQSITLYNSKPNIQLKHILETDLGSDVIKELKSCHPVSFDTQKFYQINLENSNPIYVYAESRVSSTPYMSPLFTSFDFYISKPDYWKC